MLQYVYQPSALGLENWPPGELRLEGIPVTTNPQEAELFVCPGSLHLFREPASLYRLPYFRGHEAQHVFFDVSDHETQYHQPCLFIRCNLRPFNLTADPNSIQIAWPVEDFKECVDLPEGGFRYDVSFHGWLYSDARKQSVGSIYQLASESSLRFDCAAYPDFYGYIENTPEGKRRKKEYWRSLKESRIALCPQSIPGVFPYRFWEAMSAGRFAILVGQDFIWPKCGKWGFPYSFTVCTADKVSETIRSVLDEFTDDQLIAKGLEARRFWVRWLNSRDWPRLHAEAVLEKAAAIHA